MIKMKHIVHEWADMITLPNGRRLEHFDDDAYPFGYSKKYGTFMLGGAGTAHTIWGINQGDKYCGRLWINSRILSFWTYPETTNELKELISLINVELPKKGESVKVNDMWRIEFPMVSNDVSSYNSDEILDYDKQSFLVKVPNYNPEISHNPLNYKLKELGYHELQKHLKSQSDTKELKMDNIIREWADEMNIGNESIQYDDYKSYPFGIKEKGKFIIGNINSTHWDSNIKSVKKSGRVWTELKIISFWDYPKTYREFKKIISEINIATKKQNINFQIGSGWKVEFPDVDKDMYHIPYTHDGIDYNAKSFFVPITDSRMYVKALRNAHDAKEEMEAQRNRHMQTPLKKKKIDIPKGLGSKRAHEPEWLKPMKESKEKYKKLLSESVEHKVALEMIRDLIKGTEWEGKVFLAGGGVRDELMGKDIKDLDLTIAAPQGGIKFAEWLAKKLNIYKQDSNPVIFPRFGTAKISFTGVNYKGTDLSKVDVETVMTRKEFYPDPTSRKPEVGYGTPEQDAERRDLTINSLLKDLSTGEIKDFTGKGMEDMKNKIIRTPMDPNIIFKEDPLRMLRAIRFTVKYGWKLPLSMIKALHDNAHLLQNISAERIQDELNKILMTSSPQKGIKMLQILNLNKYIIPEFEKLVNMAQNEFHEFTTDRHTYEVIKNSKPDLIVRLAAFFHDIGKGDTKTEKGFIVCKNCKKGIEL